MKGNEKTLSRLDFHKVGILLGSNIDPDVHLPLAIQQLSDHFPIEILSSVWESEAVGSDGPNFHNAAALVGTMVDDRNEMRQILRSIESRLGRVRKADKNAPRTIDLDIVIWDSKVVDEDLWKYPHMVMPVSEILPNILSSISGEAISQVAKNLAIDTPIQNKGQLFVGTPWLADHSAALIFENSSRSAAIR